ncbi:hypothetical protein GDO86_016636 [Hymenochirus boettgeri]|nr:hypothetical protein GDO86_016636 [Hymenochirus boettgeri]
MCSIKTLTLTQQKQLAANITQVLSVYGFIADSYIIEFFTNRLWEKLPHSWREALSDLPPPYLADQLLSKENGNKRSYRSVWPLSLLALKVTAHCLTFPRTPFHDATKEKQKRPEEFQENHCQSSMLDPLFRKHVKPKKQHEIRRLGQLVKTLSDKTGCDRVVDIGSGQGHLSRFLAFGCGLSVTAVEADNHLVEMAEKFDHDLIYMLEKKANVNIGCSTNPPRHVIAWINPKALWEDLVKQLSDESFLKGRSYACCQGDSCKTEKLQSNGKIPEDQIPDLRSLEIGAALSFVGEHGSSNQCALGRAVNFSHGSFQHALNPTSCSSHSAPPLVPFLPENRCILTGLHACGDLSAAMLRHFVRCPDIIAITSVACCYMKLTTIEMPEPPGVLPSSHSRESSDLTEYGYPLSSWVAQLPGHKLSYKAREVACHAIEDYTERLKGDSSILKTHCYRAVLETVIRGIDPSMIRAGVQTIKKAHVLPFKEYARQGLARVGLDPEVLLDELSIEPRLSQHQNVVVFFTLSLLLAPLVETLILLDRMIFLHEHGFSSDLIPLFKPQFSPRNLVLVAAKAGVQTGYLLEQGLDVKDD